MEINLKNVLISLSKFVLCNVFKILILLVLWFLALVSYMEADIECSKVIISAFVFLPILNIVIDCFILHYSKIIYLIFQNKILFIFLSCFLIMGCLIPLLKPFEEYDLFSLFIVFLSFLLVFFLFSFFLYIKALKIKDSLSSNKIKKILQISIKLLGLIFVFSCIFYFFFYLVITTKIHECSRLLLQLVALFTIVSIPVLFENFLVVKLNQFFYLIDDIDIIKLRKIVFFTIIEFLFMYSVFFAFLKNINFITAGYIQY